MKDRQPWDLRGPVHTCQLQRTWYLRRCGTEACETEERGDRTSLEFRADGLLARHHHQNLDGSEWTTTYEYNHEEQLTAVHNRSSSETTWLRFYEYDLEGRLIRILTRSQEGNERVAESLTYNSAGQKTRVQYVDRASQKPNTGYSWGVEGTDSFYSAEGAATLTTHYNQRQQPVELLFHDEVGQLLNQVRFYYDAEGNLIEEAQVRQAVTLPPEVIMEMSSEQLKTLRVFLGVDEPLRRLHRYDEQGRRIESRGSMGPLGGDCKRMTYNEQGDLSEEFTEYEQREYNVDEAGRLSDVPASQQASRSEARLHYDYDERGNWLRKTIEARAGTSQDFALSSVEQRTICYFE